MDEKRGAFHLDLRVQCKEGYYYTFLISEISVFFFICIFLSRLWLCKVTFLSYFINTSRLSRLAADWPVKDMNPDASLYGYFR